MTNRVVKVIQRLCTLGAMLAIGSVEVSTASTFLVDEPVDRYGAIAWEDEKARLDNFAIELQNNPGYRGHIVVFAGRRACRNEARVRALRARDYVVRVRGVESDRILWEDGGYREDVTTILVIAPREVTRIGLNSTIKQSEVEIVKNCRGGLPIRRRHK